MLEDRNLLSTFTVDHLADDMVGSGLNGSLRYAITNAVDNDTITFGVTGTINLAGALPNLTHSVSIEGPGADQLTVRRNTGGIYNIFTLTSAAPGPIPHVSISELTIGNGTSGIRSTRSVLTLNDLTVRDCGTGIYTLNDGLTLNNCTVMDNSLGISNSSGLTLNSSTVRGNYGSGGIHNFRTLTLNNSTVSGNSTPTSENDGALVTYAGGIYNEGPRAMLTLNNSTVSGNYIDNSYQYDYDGAGGIYNDGYYGGAMLTLNSSTVSGNYIVGGSSGSGQGDLLNYGRLQLRNSIIYHTNVDGESGYNLVTVDPRLGPLQDNGGPTFTMAPLAGSPALNAGDPTQLGVADQRGVVRSGGVNIGAYQASASAFVLTVPDTVASGTPFDVTVQAVDAFGQAAFGYTGTVTFSVTDTDPAVVLPLDYTLMAGDQGRHTFSGAFTLITPGDQTLTVADLANGLSKDGALTVNP
jgi:hypothetical protein